MEYFGSLIYKLSEKAPYHTHFIPNLLKSRFPLGRWLPSIYQYKNDIFNVGVYHTNNIQLNVVTSLKL